MKPTLPCACVLIPLKAEVAKEYKGLQLSPYLVANPVNGRCQLDLIFGTFEFKDLCWSSGDEQVLCGFTPEDGSVGVDVVLLIPTTGTIGG